MKEASEGLMNGIVAYTEDDVVSTDIISEPPCTCVFDAEAGFTLNHHFVKPIVWYDNEWVYSCKVLDLFMHTARGWQWGPATAGEPVASREAVRFDLLSIQVRIKPDIPATSP